MVQMTKMITMINKFNDIKHSQRMRAITQIHQLPLLLLVSLLLVLDGIKTGARAQCPWTRESIELHSDCICDFNPSSSPSAQLAATSSSSASQAATTTTSTPINRMSVQCAPVDFGHLLQALKQTASIELPSELIQATNSSSGSSSAMSINQTTTLDEPQQDDWQQVSSRFVSQAKIDLLHVSNSSIGELGPDTFVLDLASLRPLAESTSVALETRPLPPLEGSSSSRRRRQQLLVVAIQSLHLSRCQIVSIHERAFAGLEFTLTSLSLADNQLEHVPSGALERLAQLKVLDLSNNRLTRVPANSFAGLSRLNTLRLADNRLAAMANNLTSQETPPPPPGGRRCSPTDGATGGGIEEGAFAGLENSLTDLSLKSTQLGELPRALRALRRLAFLNLAQNRIAHLEGGCFRSMGSLTAINLERNRLAQLPESTFAGVEQSLSSLSLLGNLMQQFPTRQLARLAALRRLDLGFNDIQSVPVDAFAGHRKLMLIALDGNPIETLPELAFRPLEGVLRGMSVGGRELNCDCRLSWMLRWQREFNLQISSRERQPQFCARPNYLRSLVSFAALQPEHLTCEPPPPSLAQAPVAATTATTRQQAADHLATSGGTTNNLELLEPSTTSTLTATTLPANQAVHLKSPPQAAQVTKSSRGLDTEATTATTTEMMPTTIDRDEQPATTSTAEDLAEAGTSEELATRDDDDDDLATQPATVAATTSGADTPGTEVAPPDSGAIAGALAEMSSNRLAADQFGDRHSSAGAASTTTIGGGGVNSSRASSLPDDELFLAEPEPNRRKLNHRNGWHQADQTSRPAHKQPADLVRRGQPSRLAPVAANTDSNATRGSAQARNATASLAQAAFGSRSIAAAAIEGQQQQANKQRDSGRRIWPSIGQAGGGGGGGASQAPNSSPSSGIIPAIPTTVNVYKQLLRLNQSNQPADFSKGLRLAPDKPANDGASHGGSATMTTSSSGGGGGKTTPLPRAASEPNHNWLQPINDDIERRRHQQPNRAPESAGARGQQPYNSLAAAEPTLAPAMTMAQQQMSPPLAGRTFEKSQRTLDGGASNRDELQRLAPGGEPTAQSTTAAAAIEEQRSIATTTWQAPPQTQPVQQPARQFANNTRMSVLSMYRLSTSLPRLPSLDSTTASAAARAGPQQQMATSPSTWTTFVAPPPPAAAREAASSAEERHQQQQQPPATTPVNGSVRVEQMAEASLGTVQVQAQVQLVATTSSSGSSTSTTMAPVQTAAAADVVSSSSAATRAASLPTTTSGDSVGQATATTTRMAATVRFVDGLSSMTTTNQQQQQSAKTTRPPAVGLSLSSSIAPARQPISSPNLNQSSAFSSERGQTTTTTTSRRPELITASNFANFADQPVAGAKSSVEVLRVKPSTLASTLIATSTSKTTTTTSTSTSTTTTTTPSPAQSDPEQQQQQPRPAREKDNPGLETSQALPAATTRTPETRINQQQQQQPHSKSNLITKDSYNFVHRQARDDGDERAASAVLQTRLFRLADLDQLALILAALLCLIILMLALATICICCCGGGGERAASRLDGASGESGNGGGGQLKPTAVVAPIAGLSGRHSHRNSCGRRRHERQSMLARVLCCSAGKRRHCRRRRRPLVTPISSLILHNGSGASNCSSSQDDDNSSGGAASSSTTTGGGAGHLLAKSSGKQQLLAGSRGNCNLLLGSSSNNDSLLMGGRGRSRQDAANQLFRSIRRASLRLMAGRGQQQQQHHTQLNARLSNTMGGPHKGKQAIGKRNRRANQMAGKHDLTFEGAEYFIALAGLEQQQQQRQRHLAAADDALSSCDSDKSCSPGANLNNRYNISDAHRAYLASKSAHQIQATRFVSTSARELMQQQQQQQQGRGLLRTAALESDYFAGQYDDGGGGACGGLSAASSSDKSTTDDSRAPLSGPPTGAGHARKSSLAAAFVGSRTFGRARRASESAHAHDQQQQQQHSIDAGPSQADEFLITSDEHLIPMSAEDQWPEPYVDPEQQQLANSSCSFLADCQATDDSTAAAAAAAARHFAVQFKQPIDDLQQQHQQHSTDSTEVSSNYQQRSQQQANKRAAHSSSSGRGRSRAQAAAISRPFAHDDAYLYNWHTMSRDDQQQQPHSHHNHDHSHRPARRSHNYRTLSAAGAGFARLEQLQLQQQQQLAFQEHNLLRYRSIPSLQQQQQQQLSSFGGASSWLRWAPSREAGDTNQAADFNSDLLPENQTPAATEWHRENHVESLYVPASNLQQQQQPR